MTDHGESSSHHHADESSSSDEEHSEHSSGLEKLLESLAASGQPVELPVQQHLLPALVELCLSTRVLEESHVACLSLERLCLSALGLENTQPSQRYQPLLEFEIAQYANLGRGALYMPLQARWCHAEAVGERCMV